MLRTEDREVPTDVQKQTRTSSRDDVSAASARGAQLRYVTDKRPGIRRLRCGSGFRFLHSDGRRVKRADSKRIRELVIPPAWENVWICLHANGHLQATGRDTKGRKQYLYHSQWHSIRNETKFDRMIEFARALPPIRRRISRDLRLRGLPREKVLAAVVRLMERTNIRVGNPEYAEENQSFGLSTMRNRHVRVRGQQLQFRFQGKSGRFHQVDLASQRLARIVKRCLDLPGYELFQYVGDDGEIRDVTSDHVNGYLREIAGEDFTAKDFRTWAGTVLAAEILRHHDGDDNEEPTEKALIQAIDEVAAALGNTRAVCRRYYIHPSISDAYLNGTIGKWFDSTQPRRSKTGLSTGEKAVLRLLKRVRIERRQ